MRFWGGFMWAPRGVESMLSRLGEGFVTRSQADSGSSVLVTGTQATHMFEDEQVLRCRRRLKECGFHFVLKVLY